MFHYPLAPGAPRAPDFPATLTVSQPFPKPASGKIAVKVINHYGDEVLQVFEV